VARLVEQAGFETVSFGEHSHIPASRQTPYPAGDGQLPPGYERLLDLVVTLTCAALATKSIRLATGIMQMVQRDPIHAAKAAANIEEMRNHGVDPETRYELLEERVLAMREIWTQDEASFHGRFVDFERIWSWPKPVQDPMPVLIGGNSDGVEERARRVGTGWAPLAFPGTPGRIRAYLTRAREDAVETTVTAVGGGPLSAEVLEEYADAGAERYLYGLPIPLDEGEFVDGLERVLAAEKALAGAP
jgi:alkanesulfonate monooxygenase SsuD/methylene tetrahydromethanopterin reductase-like flavin-dependent oxidoreductase (luciferase family)